MVPLLGAGHYTVLEQYEQAITILEEALTLNPNSMHAALALAECYSALGRVDEARQYVAQALAINPQITVDALIARVPFRDSSTTERLVGLLRQAGLR